MALNLMEENNFSHGKFYFCWGVFNSYCLIVIFNGFYSLCYWFEFPFMERYKALEEPWPWHDDKQTWNKLYWRTLFLYGFNALVIGPTTYSPFYLLDLEVELDMTIDGLPNSLKLCG